MSKTADKSDPALWDRVKDEITAGDKGGDAGQWSARKAQMAVREYKKRGGGYEDDKDDDNALRQWTDEQNADDESTGASDEPTKAELYQEAKRRDISGRSSMTKDDLARSIDDAN